MKTVARVAVSIDFYTVPGLTHWHEDEEGYDVARADSGSSFRMNGRIISKDIKHSRCENPESVRLKENAFLPEDESSTLSFYVIMEYAHD